MTRALLCALASTACGGAGVVIDVSAAPDVPKLDALRVEVSQGPVLVTQTFLLASKPLPQSVAIVSKGMTQGTVSVVVQGLHGATVEALGVAQAELKAASSNAHVAVTLSRLCNSGVCGCTPVACGAGSSCGQLDDGCGGKLDCGSCAGSAACTMNRCAGSGCLPATCADAGAECGQVPDGCNGFLSCGGCDAGTCGGGGANRCGATVCPPMGSCSGLECGYISDGCAGVMGCGSCSDGGTCGTSAANICGCRPSSVCPTDQQCGAWPDGCGGMLDCGGCDAGTTCGGGGTANQCGCTPLSQCPSDACESWPDGCGGTLTCPSSCVLGKCNLVTDGGSGGECGCAGGMSLCGTQCVDLSTDSLNCGACNNACPAQSCWGGLCPCVDAASNSDGHCCPPGWDFVLPFMSATSTPRCYLGPFDAGSHDEALATCRAATQAGYGRAASAVGTGLNTAGHLAIPQGACGLFWQDPADETVLFTVSATATSSQACNATCGMNCSTCTTCSCAVAPAACVQPYYCGMDALGPRVNGACTSDGDCPPGDRCQGGVCVSGWLFCMLASDCDAGIGCQWRGVGQSGLCQ